MEPEPNETTAEALAHLRAKAEEAQADLAELERKAGLRGSNLTPPKKRRKRRKRRR